MARLEEAVEVEEEALEVAPPVPVEAAMGVEVAPLVPVEAAVGVVVAAPAPVPFEIWSLPAAPHAFAASLPDGAHVRVRAIKLDQAEALELLLNQQVDARDWTVHNLGRVSFLARVDYLLDVGTYNHLETVADHPHDTTHLDALRIWTWTLQDAAADVGYARFFVGGSLYTLVKSVPART